jgi:D-lyxose ketol-isomerase
MKRSEINQIMRSADVFMREYGYRLPPFAFFTPADWAKTGPEATEISANGLGWDITDFGSGRFNEIGLFMFTVRNGHPSNWAAKTGKLYCEKIMIVGVGQITPMHFHWNKMEDIINRGGGDMLIQLYNSTSSEDLDMEKPIQVSLDGVARTYEPGSILRIKTGESISLPPFLYHSFWGEGSTVLVGEVSLVNDDQTDNRFHEPVGRFPEVIEDEEPLYLLVNDYKKFYPYA